MNGGCPQGSLLGVFLFNVSTDNVEQSPDSTQETDAVRVGKFFDEADRNYLLQNESLELNLSSELLPSINMSSDSSLSDYEPDHAPAMFFASTPSRDNPPDIHAFGSPVSVDAHQLTSESDSSAFEVALGRPRYIEYTDSNTSLDEPVLAERWSDRELRCFKYVDDCLSIEKINFKNERDVTNRSSNMRATKTERHYQTVEINADSRGMKLNNEKVKCYVFRQRNHTCHQLLLIRLLVIG